MACQIYEIEWCGINLEARYKTNDFDGVIAHLEIESIHLPKAPLPITKTGYKSHFHPIGTIERIYNGDVVAFVLDWLNKEAKSKAWCDYVETSKQLSLF